MCIRDSAREAQLLSRNTEGALCGARKTVPRADSKNVYNTKPEKENGYDRKTAQAAR